MMGDDVDAAMGASFVDRGSAQLCVAGCACSSTTDGTKGGPSAEERGPLVVISASELRIDYKP